MEGTTGEGGGTSGPVSGTTPAGWFAAIWAGYSLIVAVLTALDVGAALHAIGGGPVWPVATNGASSWLLLTLIFPAVLWLAAATQPGQVPWPRIAGLQATAAIAYAVANVGGYSGVRWVVYRVFGRAYDFGSDTLTYELPREVAAYALLVALLWIVLRRRRRALAAQARRDPAVFEIRDGAHVIRAPVGSILAVSSAGNYVEFHLAGGRKPLMRATLAAIEARLAPLGFARTHRSWLVNRARIVEIQPAGSGDFKLRLAEEVSVPLSRRYRAGVELPLG